MSTDHAHSSPSRTDGLPRRAALGAVIMIALIGLFFLLREHWTHLSGYWVYLILLACPLIHMFHGHGGHGERQNHGAPPREAKNLNP